MSRWHELKLTVAQELEEALGEFAQGKGWRYYTKTWPEAAKTELRVYWRNWSGARECRRILASFIGKAEKWGLRPGKSRWQLGVGSEKTWLRRSLQEFIPKKISRRIVVKPSWKKYRAPKEEIVVEIDPQMAFGTGHHFTTRFCLRGLDRWRDGARRVLDVGCGSGILAIAAAKLGAREVTGIDNDPLAVATARENARKNGVEKIAKFHAADIVSLRVKRSNLFDIVLANITAPVLLAHRRKIRSLVSSGGLLIVTGVLRAEKRKFLRQFQAKNFRIVQQKESSLWCGFIFSRSGGRGRESRTRS